MKDADGRGAPIAPGQPDDTDDPRRLAARLLRAAAGGVLLVLASTLGLLGQEARAEQQLRILTGGVWPPFMMYDASGVMTGFEIDLANALCGVLSLQCVFTEVSFDQIIPALDAGKGDAIVASMTITEPRSKLVAFTNPYYHSTTQFLAPRGFNKPLTPEGLKGLRIGVSMASIQERYAREKFGAASEIVPFGIEKGDSYGDVYRGLVEGKVDIILAPLLTSWPFINSAKGHDFELIGDKIAVDQGVGIAVRKDDQALRDRLNAAIARLRLDGTYQKINAKYYPFSIY